MYDHGKIINLNYVDPNFFNRFLLSNTMKMLGYFDRMGYLYKVEKKISREASFWLVTVRIS